MTPAEFRAALASRNLSQMDFARMTGAAKGSVWQWCSGKRAVPHWIRPYLFLLDFYVKTTGGRPGDS